MTKASSTCASCGSVVPARAAVCDICGHELGKDAHATSGAAVTSSPREAAPASPRGRVAPQQTGKKSAKSGKSAAVLFTTPQWIAITVAAFILGAVAASALVSSRGGADTAAAEGQQQAQGASPDLQRLEETRAAVEATPDNPDALLAYSHALHDSGMPDQAIVQYKRYLAFRPDDPDARVDLGICYFEKKEYQAAITEMERAVAKFPDHQLGNYNLGIVNLNAGNKDKAREWFMKARDIDPSSPHGVNAAQLLTEHF